MTSSPHSDSSGRTCTIGSRTVEFGYRDVCLEHDTGPQHIESPDRLRAIRQRLDGAETVNYVSPDDADEATIASVHDADYLQWLREFCAAGGGLVDPDTIAVPETWEAAIASAGIAEWAGRRAFDGDTVPFALCRPPGHHATATDAMGCCFINNVAVAAQSAIDRGKVDRVAIFDWDAHHGNGTQEIFYDREDVCYVSFHEEDLYPHTGAMTKTGVEKGDGWTINAPFPCGSGDAAYRHVFDEVVIPAFERFNPDLVLVSAGFDAHERDPNSRLRVTNDGFGYLTAQLTDLVNHLGAGLGFVLEGGYALTPLAEGVETVHAVCNGSSVTPPAADGGQYGEWIANQLHNIDR